jgi:hypothetical protein
MKANVVVGASVARENGVIQCNTTIVESQLLAQSFHNVVKFRDGADIAIITHTANQDSRNEA